MKKKLVQLLFLLLTLPHFAQQFSTEEQKRITSGDANSKMKVIQSTDEKELKILKSVATDVDLSDPLLPVLTQRMFLSMRDPANPGIGIAAPQVGINKNVFWVQRFDKAGEPFELYLNPKITWRSALLRKGTEGCLSIPDFSAEVLRNYSIQVDYYDKNGKFHQEIVEGFTAVVFQHEFDHLKGTLFTDRLKEQEKKTFTRVTAEDNLYLEPK